jgi:hypothetical protein
MKKEEILEKSRKENKNKDMVTLQESYKGATYAAIAMVLLAFIYFTYEMLQGKGTNYALYSLICMYNAVLNGWLALKVKESKVLRIINFAIWGLLTIMLVLEYFNVI